jgi:putative phage-type endonuclease
MPSDTTTPSEYVSAKKLARPSLLDCRVYGFATVFVNKPLVTEHDPGVDVMRISEMVASGVFPHLANAMKSVVGLDIMMRKRLKIPMRVMSLLCSEFPAQRSPEWHAERRKLLTASETASVLGDNKYQTSAQLMEQKIAGTTLDDNEAMAHGRLYEDEALQLFVELTQVPCFALGLVTWHEHGVGASVDAITYDGRIVEIKCPLNRWVRKGIVPKAYNHQMQQQALVIEKAARVTNSFIFYVEYKVRQS